MKTNNKKRLEELEDKMRSCYADQFFDEWLQENHSNGVKSYMAILETVPQEFRHACIIRIFEEIHATPQ